MSAKPPPPTLSLRRPSARNTPPPPRLEASVDPSPPAPPAREEVPTPAVAAPSPEPPPPPPQNVMNVAPAAAPSPPARPAPRALSREAERLTKEAEADFFVSIPQSKKLALKMHCVERGITMRDWLLAVLAEKGIGNDKASR